MKKTILALCMGAMAAVAAAQIIPNGEQHKFRATSNPIVKHKHTADPAPFVKGDTLFLYTGVDFAGATGTNIWAADGGVVIHAGWKGNYGYCVIIDHQNGYTTYYAHCSKLLVKKGDKVAQGDIIAKVGNTGRSYGAHVHFEILYYGKTQNPLNYISK